MADRDININVNANAQQAKADLDSFAKTTGNLGQETEQAGEKAKSSGGAFSNFANEILSWMGSLGSVAGIIAGITSAIRAQIDAINEHSRIAQSQQQSLLRLQYLGEFFRENPNLRKEVQAYSEYGRRPFEEVASAWYNLRSKAGSLSKEQQQSILKEALEMGRTDVFAPLDTLVDMFSLYAKKTGATDMNRVQNILMQTTTEAGSDIKSTSQYMPEFLPIGMSGGLTGPQSAAMWAWATTQTNNPSVATTGLKAMFMGLQGKETPESAKVLKTLGLTPDMNFFQKIAGISSQYASGRFSLGQAQQLAGDTGASILISLLKDPQSARNVISKISGVDRPDLDIAGASIRDLTGSDEMVKTEENLRLLNIAIENKKGSDLKALRGKELMQESEFLLRQEGVPEWFIGPLQWYTKIKLGLGQDPESVRQHLGPVVNYHNDMNINISRKDNGGRGSGPDSLPH